MRLIRPFAVNDAALLFSSISESPGVALEGDMTDGNDALLLEGDMQDTGSDIELFEGTEAYPYDWNELTLYGLGEQAVVVDDDYHHVFESLTAGTSSAVTITVATPGVVSWAAHGLTAGTPVTFTTTGALPTGIDAGTIYYVVSPTTDAFSVAATVGGAAIATSGTQSGTHTAIANPNLGKAPRNNPEFWLDLGNTNRWKMFDRLNGSQTTAFEAIEVRIATTGRIDAIALLNIAGVSVRVVSETADGNVVFDQTYSLVSSDGITNWYAYFFEEIVRKGDLTIIDLPPYVDQTLTVTLTAPGEAVAIGTMVLGQLKTLGDTVYGATLGITDYSRKDTDDFGNYIIVERAFAKRGTFKVLVDDNRIDEIQRELSKYRATPIVYLGTDAFASTQFYGFFKTADLDLEGPNESWLSIEIEGLT